MFIYLGKIHCDICLTLLTLQLLNLVYHKLSKRTNLLILTFLKKTIFKSDDTDETTIVFTFAILFILFSIVSYWGHPANWVIYFDFLVEGRYLCRRLHAKVNVMLPVVVLSYVLTCGLKFIYLGNDFRIILLGYIFYLYLEMAFNNWLFSLIFLYLKVILVLKKKIVFGNITFWHNQIIEQPCGINSLFQSSYTSTKYTVTCKFWILNLHPIA